MGVSQLGYLEKVKWWVHVLRRYCIVAKKCVDIMPEDVVKQVTSGMDKIRLDDLTFQSKIFKLCLKNCAWATQSHRQSVNILIAASANANDTTTWPSDQYLIVPTPSVA